MHCRWGGAGECELRFGWRVVVRGPEHVLDGDDETAFGATCDVLAEFLAEQCFERLSELAGRGVGVIDQETFEEGLVELAAELVGALR